MAYPWQKVEFLFFPLLLLSLLPARPLLLLPRAFLVTCIVGSFCELAALVEETGWFSTRLVS